VLVTFVSHEAVDNAALAPSVDVRQHFHRKSSGVLTSAYEGEARGYISKGRADPEGRGRGQAWEIQGQREDRASAQGTDDAFNRAMPGGQGLERPRVG